MGSLIGRGLASPQARRWLPVAWRLVQALILVGRAIDPELRRVAASKRSNLYDPDWSHIFRLAEGRGRRAEPKVPEREAR